MDSSELACTYATLILYYDSIPITAEKIITLLNSANVTVESYWPGLFAKLAGKRNVEDLVLNPGSGGAAAVAVAAPAAGASGGAAPTSSAAPAAEEKKEEPKEESDDDMGFSLFD